MIDESGKSGAIGLDLFAPDSRFEDPFADLYSAASRRAGDFARVAWRVPTPGVVQLLVVERGTLPKGAGGQLVAEALTLSNTIPTKCLIVEEIINKPTIDACEAGRAPESSVLGKTAINALHLMGLSPSRCSWHVGKYQLKMVLDVEESG